jgi:hypothetical protein
MTNEGTLDRTIRIAAGLTLIALAVVGPRTPWGYLGVIPLVTGLIGFCPAYKLFGLSTCPMEQRK